MTLLTERERHKVETPDAKAKPSGTHSAGLRPTPGEGFDSPRSSRSVSSAFTRLYTEPEATTK